MAALLGETAPRDGGGCGGDELDGWWIKELHEHPTMGKPDRARLQHLRDCRACPQSARAAARALLALPDPLPPIPWKTLGMAPHGTPKQLWFR
jgi:hypothetical protein